MKRLKTAVVGSGKVAETHAAALRSLPESEFVAVCGRPSARRDAFAGRHGVRAYSDLRTMRDEAGVEAIFVCTPHLQHAAAAITAAKCGMHALVEKPLATTVFESEQVIAASRKHGVTVGVVSQRRLYPSARRIRDAIDAGKLGRPVLGTATMYGWRDEAYYKSDPWRGTWKGEGGGVLVNQAPHPLDLLAWYLGQPEEVFGFWANLNHPYVEVDDTAVAVVRFQGGALGTVLVSNSQNPAIHARVSVHGSNGASVGVQTDGGQMFISGVTTKVEPAFNDLWTIPGEAARLPEWKAEDEAFFGSVDAMTYFHHREIQQFLQSVISGLPAPVPAEAGLRVAQIIEGIYRSNQDGKSVRF